MATETCIQGCVFDVTAVFWAPCWQNVTQTIKCGVSHTHSITNVFSQTYTRTPMLSCRRFKALLHFQTTSHRSPQPSPLSHKLNRLGLLWACMVWNSSHSHISNRASVPQCLYDTHNLQELLVVFRQLQERSSASVTTYPCEGLRPTFHAPHPKLFF